jgi:hypothetical protein
MPQRLLFDNFVNSRQLSAISLRLSAANAVVARGNERKSFEFRAAA